MNLIQKFYKEIVGSGLWNIGFLENSLESVLNGDDIVIHTIKHSFKDRWFADPFILDCCDDKIIVLVEELLIKDDKGRISKLIIDRFTWKLLEVQVILELDTHLSFPFIIRRSGKVYIYPENSKKGCLDMYLYDPDTNQCTFVKNLCNEPLTDAVETPLLGEPLLFSTKCPDTESTELGIYQYDKIDQKYKFRESVFFDENIARNGGSFFLHQDVVYRPAQECNRSYGHGIVLQEVRKEHGKFFFRNIRRLYSTDSNYHERLHTFNVYKDCITVDVGRNAYPFLSRLFIVIRKIILLLLCRS